MLARGRRDQLTEPVLACAPIPPRSPTHIASPASPPRRRSVRLRMRARPLREYSRNLHRASGLRQLTLPPFPRAAMPRCRPVYPCGKNTAFPRSIRRASDQAPAIHFKQRYVHMSVPTCVVCIEHFTGCVDCP